VCVAACVAACIAACVVAVRVAACGAVYVNTYPEHTCGRRYCRGQGASKRAESGVSRGCGIDLKNEEYEMSQYKDLKNMK